MVVKKYQRLCVIIDGIKKFTLFENYENEKDIKPEFEYKNLKWYFYILKNEKFFDFGNEDSELEYIVEDITDFKVIGYLNVKKDNIIQKIAIYEYLRDNRIKCSGGYIAYDLPTHANASILHCRIPNDNTIYKILLNV